MSKSVVADHLATIGIVHILPMEACGLALSALLPHVLGQHFQKGLRPRNAGAALERFRGGDVIVLLDIVDESEMKIEMPVVWDLADAALDQLTGQVGTTSTLRRLLG